MSDRRLNEPLAEAYRTRAEGELWSAEQPRRWRRKHWRNYYVARAQVCALLALSLADRQ